VNENGDNSVSCPSMNQKQIDIVIASYAAERADCAAMFGVSTNILGFVVSSLGLAIIFLPSPKGVPEEWLFLISSIPWALLAHHSIMAGLLLDMHSSVESMSVLSLKLHQIKLCTRSMRIMMK